MFGDRNLLVDKVETRSILTFDGQDDYIDFGKNDISGVFAEGSSAFTVAGWIYPHQLTSKASTYGTHNVFFARSSDRHSDNFEFGVSESGNLDVYIDEKVDNTIKAFGNGELTVGQWHFFAVVFDQGQITVYLDDRDYVGSLTGSSLNKASSSVTLGATLHNNIYFTGQLANISIWKYSCSQTEIQKQRSQPLVGNEAGLVAYWTLNEGEGTIICDRTGNGHNGKLHGNSTWISAELPFITAQFSAESKEIQLKKTKKTGKRFADDRDSVAIQSQEEAIEIDQTSQSEVLANTQPPEPSEMFTLEESQEPVNTAAHPKYKILAIDGGGIRGIIPALILAEIEKRTQKQIFSLFDLIAGTSTGGILALGLTKPRLNAEPRDSEPIAEYSAEELVELFVEHGAEIFYEPLFGKMLGPIEDAFVRSKYSSESREEVLKQYFGDALLEKNLKEVLITSYDIEQRIPVLFTNKLKKQQTRSPKFHRLCGGFTLTDAALATGATPTYFAPHRIATCHNTNCFYTLVDGGLVANNPANLAIWEAQASGQEKTQVLNTQDFLVVSLGTGSPTSVYSYSEVRKWGLLQWGIPLLNIVFDGGSEIVDVELERFFESNDRKNKSYYRFQPFLSSELEAIDNVKLDNIRELQAVAHRLIKEKSQEIDRMCSLLLNTL